MVTLILPAAVLIAHERALCAQARAKKADIQGAKRGGGLVIPHTPIFSPENTSKQLATALSPTHEPGTGGNAAPTPLPQLKRVGPSPLTRWDPFVAAHVHASAKLGRYLREPRSQSVTLAQAAVDELHSRAAFALPANNRDARIQYAQVLGERLEEVALTLPPNRPMFFVTLVRRDYTVPRHARTRFDISRIKGWAHAELAGTNYVGMVEVGYFSNLRTLGGPNRRYFSWHTHKLVWGPTEADIAARIDDINRRYQTGVPGRTAAHYRRLRREEVFGRAIYMAKGQINEYRVWPKQIELADPSTGEVRKLPSRDYEVKKRPLRPGDAAHLCRAFAGRTVDSLAFAARDGRAVLDEINRTALAKFHHWEEHQPYKLAEERRRVEAKRATSQPV